MLNEIISAVLQLAVFTSIPFLVYLIKYKTSKGFMNYIGLKPSNRKANLLALLIVVLIALPILLLFLFNEEFKAILTDPQSVTGKFRQMGFSWEALIMVLVAAVIKTSLAEEILFRGFIAKRLIAGLGFQAGNLLQAVLFGAIHALLFMSITKNPLFLFIIFLFPTLGAYFKAYLNEKVADGSIIPGWLAHGGGNIIAYSSIGFL